MIDIQINTMVKFQSYYNRTPSFAALTEDQLKAIGGDYDNETQKSRAQREFEDRKRRLAEISAQKEKRIANTAFRRKTEKSKTGLKNQEKEEMIKLRMENIRANDHIKKLKLIMALELRDRKKAANAVKLKQDKLNTKRNKEINRYQKLFDRQKMTIQKNQACILHQNLEPKIVVKETFEIKEEEKFEAESLEKCSYVKHDSIEKNEIVHTVNKQAFDNSNHSSFRTILLNRIDKLRTNFATCQQGEAFWRKTAPLWNRMKQCLEEEIVALVEEPEWIPREYRSNVSELTMTKATDNQGRPTLMQQIMLSNVNYGPTDNNDNMIIDAMKKAKELSEPNANANDVIYLTRMIVEHEADIRINVDFMMHGLVERGIFEYTKKRISATIFVDARKSIDRLRHINDSGVIPNKLIKSKNKIEVATVVNDLIRNDHLYSRFDRPLDDDKYYLALVSETGTDRIRAFLASQTTETISMKLFPMDGRRQLFEDVNDVVTTFLVMAHQKTAHFVSTTKPDDLKFAGSSTLTMCMVYRICRKLAKLVLGMFRSDERKAHNFWATVHAYKALLSKRSPCVVYDRRVFKPPQKINMKYYRKLFDDMNPRKKKTVPHVSFVRSSWQ